MDSYPSATDWRDLAACKTTPTDVFFPISDKGRAREDVDRARAVCARCQVRSACLAYAVATRQRHGIWGGLTEDERRALWADGVRLRFVSTPQRPISAR